MSDDGQTHTIKVLYAVGICAQVDVLAYNFLSS